MIRLKPLLTEKLDLNEMRKDQAIRKIYKEINPLIRGFFKNDYWRPIQAVSVRIGLESNRL